MGKAPGGCDPFAMTADPGAYLERGACERALAALRSQILGTSGPTALTGPPGLGKTLLLRVLASRLAARARFVYLPYPSLPPEGLCAWSLGEMRRAESDNPEAALLACAAEERADGRSLVLLVDDAGHLPLPTVRGLVDLCAESRGALRMAVAATDGIRTGAVLAALGPGLVEVRLSLPMDRTETLSYVRHRLEGALLARHTRDRFAEPELERLHRESGGVPRNVHRLAAELIRDLEPCAGLPKSTDLRDLANDDPGGP